MDSSQPHRPAWLESVHHDGSERYLSDAYPHLGDSATIRLRTHSTAPVEKVYLRTFPDGEQAITPMQRADTQPPVQWWEISVRISQPVFHYRFALQTANDVWWYSAGGIQNFDPLDATDFQILANYRPPRWVHRSVFYQIFPDRYTNGDPTNDPQPGDFTYRGHHPETYPWEAPPSPEKPFPLVFYGGDLQGITQRLDYLQSLGVNGLYLNPIFTAHSNHKYDVVDYELVDLHFGGDQALIELRESLTTRGMHYLLDIVPNHCGYWHPWFQAARLDIDSLEAGFFTFQQHPDDYATWLGVWSLPKLNYQSHELRERIYGRSDSVFRRWLKPPFAADGWRIDVANMLGRQGATQVGKTIAREIRQGVKDANPEAYLIGENFYDATTQLQGDQWDGVMNYMGFTMPLWHWLRGYQQTAWGLQGKINAGTPWPTTALEAAWCSRRAVIPWAILLQQFNLLDSHDTPRIRSIVSQNDALQRLAAIVQFTFPGVPCLYYGDEIGMADTPELASRACMVWDEGRWDHDLLAFYRRLIQLRRQSTILQTGGFQMLAVEPDTFAYQREDPSGHILVVAHRGASPRLAGPLQVDQGGVPDGSRFREVFSGHTTEVRDGQLWLPAQPQGASLWIQSSWDVFAGLPANTSHK
jgi:alpha-glucosidase